MLTCVDGVSLRQNSRQDSPWGGKSPFGQRLGENHRNPLLPEIGIPALFAARPPPVFHRKERLVSRLWQMDTDHLSVLRERALSAPQRETEGFFDNPGEDRNTVPTLQGKPGT